MYVGVILHILSTIVGTLRIPHVCGGDPHLLIIWIVMVKYSPCMWG